MARKILLTSVIVAAVAAGAALFVFKDGVPTTTTNVEISPAAGDSESAAGTMAEQAAEPSEATKAYDAAHDTAEATAVAAPASAIDIEKALAARSVGNPEAPVKLEEFASLSCSHCADFYKNTYPKLKADYIDTGKVYFTYTDFPLNAPALEAALVARCLPENHYFNFVKVLFENQKDWAFSEKFSEALQHNAAMLGMSTDGYNSCVGNQELRQGVVDRMQKAAEEHKIQSTPSFVFNNKEPMPGAVDYEAFKKKIDELLAAQN